MTYAALPTMRATSIIRRTHLLAMLAAWAVLAIAAPACLAAPQPVTLQLKWKHQFQFAGYYVALEKGYFRDAGFDVRLAEADGAEDTVTTVVSGKAEFGVAGSELALKRAQGEPVVALATILQHSALALAVRGGTALTVHDLEGKRVMLSPHDQELTAWLQREGLMGSRLRQVPQTFDIRDLVDGRVQGFSVYTTDQVWDLKKAGLPYTLLSPRAGGIDFYGDTLFTTEALARSQPARVLAFREAALRGWQYAMSHPVETADLILARFSPQHSREHLLFEAGEMARLMQPQLIEIGHMNPARWRHIADVYAELGMLPRNFSLDGFLLAELQAAPAQAGGWLVAGWVLAAAAGAAAAALAWQNQRLRQALRASGAPAAAVSAAGGKAAMAHDALTGLYGRAYLDETLARDLRRATRQGEPLALAVLRIDNFAQAVREDGPAAGDALLAALAARLRPLLQPGDYACRLDGPALAWVMPGQDAQAAGERAAALCQAFTSQATWSGLIEVRGTASARVASAPQDGPDAAALLARAGA